MRRLLFAALLLGAAPADAEDGTYRCMAENLVYWTGDSVGTVETLPPSEYEIALDLHPGTGEEAEWAEAVSTGERFELDRQPEVPAELVATRADNRFTLRIDLDATPLRFAGIGATSVLTGTCFFEPGRQNETHPRLAQGSS